MRVWFHTERIAARRGQTVTLKGYIENGSDSAVDVTHVIKSDPQVYWSVSGPPSVNPRTTAPIAVEVQVPRDLPGTCASVPIELVIGRDQTDSQTRASTIIDLTDHRRGCASFLTAPIVTMDSDGTVALTARLVNCGRFDLSIDLCVRHVDGWTFALDTTNVTLPVDADPVDVAAVAERPGKRTVDVGDTVTVEVAADGEVLTSAIVAVQPFAEKLRTKSRRAAIVVAALIVLLALFLPARFSSVPLSTAEPAPAQPQPRPDSPNVGSAPSPYTFSDDPNLDALWIACAGGDGDACVQLYRTSPSGSGYESFAASHFPVSAQDELEYEQLLKQRLEPGSIVYSTPQSMRVGDRETVTARITREDLQELGGTADEIFADLPSGGAAIQAEELEVGASMRTTLEGDGWEITPVGADSQRLRLTGHREWQWIIKPLRSGNLTLHLTVYVVNDGEDIDSVPLRRDVVVAVHPLRSVSGFLSRNWQWIVTTLLSSGVLATLGRRHRTRRRAKAAEEPKPAADDQPAGYL